MFENVVGHGPPVAQLSADRADGRLPRAILLHGPEYCGKLTIALELARGLTCTAGDAVWNCTCRSCRLQRLLIHPDTVMIGPRYFMQEIRVAGDAYTRTPSKPTAYLFIRAVRKLTRRYDALLWDENDAATQKIGAAIATIDELLEVVDPDREPADAKTVEKTIRAIRSACDELAAGRAVQSIAVEAVRKIAFWTRSRSTYGAKVVIIENGDSMLESARNAFLKTLEEPPRDVWFIMMTTRRSAIIPTILSRLRTYAFYERTPDENADVIRKIFRDEPESPSLRRYFQQEPFDRLAETYLECVANPGGTALHSVIAEVAAAFKRGNDSAPRYFLEELIGLIRRVWRAESQSDGTFPFPLERLEHWSSAIHRHYDHIAARNMNAELVLHALAVEMERV